MSFNLAATSNEDQQLLNRIRQLAEDRQTTLTAVIREAFALVLDAEPDEVAS